MDALPVGAGAPERTTVFSNCMAWKTAFWVKKAGGTASLTPLPVASNKLNCPPEEKFIKAAASLVIEAEPRHPLVMNF